MRSTTFRRANCCRYSNWQEKQISWAIYSIITDVYNPIPERLKDWVTTPKSNGYESLHTTVIGPNGNS
ncbi:MAG: hypothetical protein IPL23_16280 [Saprospiraceae bacterium]|nr:hypothetical protein [Saprospiraceae bacterium]